MNIIEISHLSKYYGKSKGIEDISLEVKQGEIFGFIGPNGAGKLTTIRILLNLIFPTSGIARIMGMDVVKESGKTMNRYLFRMELKRNAASLMIWSAVISLLVFFTMAFFPTFLKNQQQIMSFFQVLPLSSFYYRGISDIPEKGHHYLKRLSSLIRNNTVPFIVYCFLILSFYFYELNLIIEHSLNQSNL